MAAPRTPSRPLPRLYLATPSAADEAVWTAALPDLLAAADIAAVLLRLTPGDPRAMLAQVKAVAPIVQAAGAALLLDGHAELVARGGADGAQVAGTTAMQEALPSLKPARILGVGGLVTRHDAMTAGEAGADYVLFGEPDAHGARPSLDAIAERLDWWAELFEPPCVGYAASLDEIETLAAAGADFILTGDSIWRDPRGARPALMDAAQAIRQGHGAIQGRTRAEAG